MRIDQAYGHTPSATNASVAGTTSVDRTPTQSGGAAPAAQAPVTVTVSEQARALSAHATEVSAAKVANLQESMANGTFKIDPHIIASRIVGGD
jgi:flagellar biosynthesis anti-sigma factor FlgM